MKIAVIGYGNIANAILNGILNSENILLTDDIYIFHNKNHNNYSKENCTFLHSGEVCKNMFDVVLLCVKPKDIERAINENLNLFNNNQIVVSVAAGVTLEKINSLIKKNVNIFRAMPNLCAIFNESITGICAKDEMDDEKIKYVEDIFRSIGYIRKISENEMDSFTALFGSGPAYIMYFIESLMKCEKFENISEDAKSLLIVNMLSSTSKMLLVSEDIKKLRKQVTSEGGTTEAAIKIFEERNFSKIIEDAIKKAAKKSFDMSK